MGAGQLALILLNRKELQMMTLDYSAIVLALIGMVSGWATYWLDRRKHRQEVDGLKADNRQKGMDLSKDYVTEWRTYIAEPLTSVDLCHDSAKRASSMALAAPSVAAGGK